MDNNKFVGRDNYILIQGFMVSELGLKGTELLVYAIIYGFSQTEGQCFTGSRSYLAEWTNCTVRGVAKCLISLKEKGLIDVVCDSDDKHIGYIALKSALYGEQSSPGDEQSSSGDEQSSSVGGTKFPQGVNKVPSGGEQSSPNNIDNNIVSKKERKRASKSYDEQIEEYTQNKELQNALKAFVQMRSFIKKPMTEYALKLMLKKLDELGNNDTTKIAILNQSITHNWQGIFPLKDEYTNHEKQQEKKYDQNGYESEEELMKMLYGK